MEACLLQTDGEHLLAGEQQIRRLSHQEAQEGAGTKKRCGRWSVAARVWLERAIADGLQGRAVEDAVAPRRAR